MLSNGKDCFIQAAENSGVFLDIWKPTGGDAAPLPLEVPSGRMLTPALCSSLLFQDSGQTIRLHVHVTSGRPATM